MSTPARRDDDDAAIAAIAETFFAAFTSGPGSDERLDALRAAFARGAVIARACGKEPLLMDVDAFIEPRRKLLTDGSLVDFSERELASRTMIFGDIAVRVATYAKHGTHDGHDASGRGIKTMHFIRTIEGWRISAVAWEDEREELDVDAFWREAGEGA